MSTAERLPQRPAVSRRAVLGAAVVGGAGVAAARRLAGWVEPRPAAITPDQPVAGTFAPQRAYKGAAFKYLGKTAQWNTDSVLDQILAQTATAPFVVTKVLQNFVMPAPSKDY